jgi:hypothetical protein
MARRPEDRYQNVHVLLEDLRSYLQRGVLRVSEEPLSLPEPNVPLRGTDMTQVFTPAPRSDRRTP